MRSIVSQDKVTRCYLQAEERVQLLEGVERDCPSNILDRIDLTLVIPHLSKHEEVCSLYGVDPASCAEWGYSRSSDCIAAIDGDTAHGFAAPSAPVTTAPPAPSYTQPSEQGIDMRKGSRTKE
jgi:hypothetical protein